MQNDLIEKAFLEDRPSGDITTQALGEKEKFGIALLIAKEDLILSGSELFNESLLFCNSELKISWNFSDGDEVLDQQTVAQIDGNLIDLIQAERVALNFLGYLSGIATQTRKFVIAKGENQTQILDTRKTIPLYRAWSKKAVVDGGGTNHRMDLSHSILIKENHICIAGGLIEAIEKTRKQTDLPITIEVQNLDEVKKAVSMNVDHIMLDNMNDEMIIQALKLIPKNIYTEASGNMNLDRVKRISSLGLSGISIGALTHSVKNADFSLLFKWS